MFRLKFFQVNIFRENKCQFLENDEPSLVNQALDKCYICVNISFFKITEIVNIMPILQMRRFESHASKW